AADTTGLAATERGADLDPVPVHAVGAGADLAGDLQAVLRVSGPHRAGQAVVAVVGDPHGVGLVFVPDDRQHWAEDLLPGDPHLVGHVRENGGRDVPAPLVRPPGAADDDLGAFPYAQPDISPDAFLLVLGGQRPDLGRRVGRVTQLHVLDHAGQRADHLVVTE